jgi:hypothetical protein
MFKAWRKKFQKRRETDRAHWNRTLQSRSLTAWKDFWHDFKQTLKEVTGEGLTAQFLAAAFILTITVLINFAIWMLVSLPMSLFLWWAWDWCLIKIFPNFFMAPITFSEAWCLCMLTNFIGFRSIRIELRQKDGEPEYK